MRQSSSNIGGLDGVKKWGAEKRSECRSQANTATCRRQATQQQGPERVPVTQLSN